MKIENLNGEQFICKVYQQKNWINLTVEDYDGNREKVAGLINVDLSQTKGVTFNFINGQPHFITNSAAYLYTLNIIKKKKKLEDLSKPEKKLLKGLVDKIFSQEFTDTRIFLTIAYNFARELRNKTFHKELRKFIKGHDSSLLSFKYYLSEVKPSFFLPEEVINVQTNNLKAEFVVIDTYLKTMNDSTLYVSKSQFYKKCINAGKKYSIVKEDIDKYFKSRDNQFFEVDDKGISFFNYKQLEKDIYNYFNNQKSFKVTKHTDGNLKDITLTKGQTKAVNSILSAPYGSMQLCSGGPGTGKTTSIRHALELASKKSKRPLYVLCLAPTGAAKTVMNNMFKGFDSCFTETKTIHSFLYTPVDPDITYDYVIVDEASMMDSNLMASLIKNDTFINAKTILMGDPKQLPSIGFGAILRDVINQGKVKQTHLTEVKRQKEGSNLLSFIKTYGEDCDSSEVYNRQAELLNIINSSTDVNLIKRSGLNNDKDLLNILNQSNILNNYLNSQIIAPTNKTINIINNYIQSINEESKALVYQKGYKKFYVGDKVMFLKNTHTEVQNGTIGFIQGFKNGSIEVQLDSGEFIVVQAQSDNAFEDDSDNDNMKLTDKVSIDDMVLGYCITVHKSQGGTWENVLYVQGDNGYYMNYNELFYTAFSRASDNLTIMCDINTITRSLSKRVNNDRQTYFNEIIKNKKKI